MLVKKSNVVNNAVSVLMGVIVCQWTKWQLEHEFIVAGFDFLFFYFCIVSSIVVIWIVIICPLSFLFDTLSCGSYTSVS